MGSNVQAEDQVPVYKSGAEVLQVLQDEKIKSSSPAAAVAMYSSVVGGIILDPAMMVIPMDDHMAHRGHGVFDTAMIMDGCLYELDAHLDRFLRSAAAARIIAFAIADDQEREKLRLPCPDDGGVGMPEGIHPLLAQLRPRRLFAIPPWRWTGVLRRGDRVGVRAVPRGRARGDHVGAHEAAAAGDDEERELPAQRAVHHGRRGPRGLRLRVGRRTGLRGGGAHGTTVLITTVPPWN